MSGKNIGETQRLIKIVQQVPFADEDKKRWLDELHENGINGEMVEEVHKKFLEIDTEKLGGDWARARFNMEIIGVTKQWGLSQGSKNFQHSH
jgi:hypothetical protein